MTSSFTVKYIGKLPCQCCRLKHQARTHDKPRQLYGWQETRQFNTQNLVTKLGRTSYFTELKQLILLYCS